MEPLPETTSESLASSYTVARLDKSRLKDLAKLHSQVYTPVADDHYFHKYDTAYTGVAYTGFVAYNSHHEPIGYYGVIPCFIRFANQVALAAQSADTMTHPGYRFKGMFVELSKMTFELCRQLNIFLLFGFPNDNSYHGAVNKLNWQPVNRMSYFIIPVNAIPFAAVAVRKKFLKKIYDRYAGWILKHYLLADEGIANSVLDDGFAGTDRTADYHRYKKNISHSKLIRVGGAKVRISIRQSVLAGDMEGVHEGNFGAVIGDLKKLSRRLGIGTVQFHCSPGTSLHLLFEDHYEPQPSYHVLFQDFGSVIPPEELRFMFADIDIF